MSFLYMSVGSGNWSQLHSAGPGVDPAEYTYSGLQDSAVYSFMLSVCNAYGCNNESVLTTNKDGSTA